jgi:hypothetical protein
VVAASILAVLLLPPWTPTPAHAQEPAAIDTARLVGEVVSAKTGKAIAGAVVSLQRSRLGTMTDSSGNFAISGAAAGQDTVEVWYAGYESSRLQLFLEPDQTTRVVLLLGPAAIQLADLHVEIQQNPLGIIAGFEQRSKQGIGHFFSREDIEKRNPRYPSDLLRQVPGLRVRRSPSGRSNVTLARRSEICSPVIFVDGLYQRDLEVDDILATDLGAVEVYTASSQIPGRFASMAPASCGAIIFWTRRGKRPG